MNSPSSAVATPCNMAFAAVLLALGSCAASSNPFPIDGRVHYSAQVPSDMWLGISQEAESTSDWAEAGLWMDRYAALPGVEPDEEHWLRRASLAERAGDAPRSIEIRRILLSLHPDDLELRMDLATSMQQLGQEESALELLTVPFASYEDQITAWSALVQLHIQNEHSIDAAERCEDLARATSGATSREWWQRASSLYERADDMPRATVCLEQALAGIQLAEKDQRVVQRLRAFGLGKPENIDDAQVLLRHHPDPEMRLVAVRYLAATEEFPRDVQSFEYVLRDPEPEVVRVALKQLALRAEPGRVRAILPLLTHVDSQIQIAAFRTLAVLGTLQEMPYFLNGMVPEDQALFRAAIVAAEAVSDFQITDGSEQDVEGRQALQEAWRSWWQQGAERDKLGR